jgi:hypothetical protein
MAAAVQGSINQFDIAFSATYIKFSNLYASAGASVDLITNSEFNVAGSGRVVFNSLQAKYGSWVGSVATLDGNGFVSIRVRDDKYGKVWANGYLLVSALSITRGTLAFSLDYLLADGGGGAMIDLYTPRFDIQGNGNLIIGDEAGGLSIKTQGGWTVSIPSSVFTGNGHVSASWDSSHLSVYGNVNVYWKAFINTQTLGSWSVAGNLNGEATINAYWTTSTSGQMVINIPRTGVMSDLYITHDNLIMDLGRLDLKPGTMTINWNRGDAGNININNQITGTSTLASLQLKYVTTGTTFDLYIGALNLVQGNGEINWDKSLQQVKITNGIISGQGLGFTLTLNDVVFSASIVGIKTNSQPIIIKWYKDASGNINGGYIHTNNQELASSIYLRVTQGNKGVEITLNGLKANNFEMKKTTSGEWQFSGTIQIASSLKVSLYWDYVWHDVILSWDMQSSAKYIQMQCKNFGEDVPIRLFSFIINDWTFASTAIIDANAFMRLEWKLLGSTSTNYIAFDTDNKPMGSVTFTATTSTMGISVTASLLTADNAVVTWNKFPPVGVTWSGFIDFSKLTKVEVQWSGTLYNIPKPPTMTDEY